MNCIRIGLPAWIIHDGVIRDREVGKVCEVEV